MYAQALTWWTILRISLEERLVYRGDFAMGTVLRFLPIVTQIFLWGAVFGAIEQSQSAAEATSGAASIRGYSYYDFVAYYLLTMVARAFSSLDSAAELFEESTKQQPGRLHNCRRN